LSPKQYQEQKQKAAARLEPKLPNTVVQNLAQTPSSFKKKCDPTLGAEIRSNGTTLRFAENSENLFIPNINAPISSASCPPESGIYQQELTGRVLQPNIPMLSPK
jgi:hypothetical protein